MEVFMDDNQQSLLGLEKYILRHIKIRHMI